MIRTRTLPCSCIVVTDDADQIIDFVPICAACRAVLDDAAEFLVDLMFDDARFEEWVRAQIEKGGSA